MRTVLITGVTSGFGQMLVQEFLRQGDLVIATGRRLTQRADSLQAARSLAKDRLIELDLDVTDPAQRKAVVQWFEKQNQSLDLLINNAGFGLFGALEDLTEEQIRGQFEVNFFGLSFLTKDLLPLLRKSKGKIINLSSVLGFMGFPLSSLYCASKHAVEGLTESLAFELKPHGVQVCLVEPGSFNTGFGPHVQWTANDLVAGSVYQKQIQNYRNFRHDLENKPPYNNLEDFPRAVYRLSQKKKLPLRLRVGKDCQAAYWGRRLLPQESFIRLMQAFFGRTINRS